MWNNHKQEKNMKKLSIEQLKKYEQEYTWNSVGKWNPERLQEIVSELTEPFGLLIDQIGFENVGQSDWIVDHGAGPTQDELCKWVSPGAENRTPITWDLRSYEQLKDCYQYLLTLDHAHGTIYEEVE
jgi:hypothetical protein